MLLITAAVLALGVYAGIAWVIYSKYRQTSDRGFLILGCGVLVWPSAARILEVSMRIALPGVAQGETKFLPFWPITGGQVHLGDLFALSYYVYQVIHGALILIGLLAIGRISRNA